MIVVDASIVLHVLLRTPIGREACTRLLSSRVTLHAPHQLDLEVAQVLRRHERTGQLETRRAGEALSDFADLEIERYAHDMLLERIWELRITLTAYDAAYVALAEVLRAPLLTTDRKLAESTGHRARIELVA